MWLVVTEWYRKSRLEMGEIKEKENKIIFRFFTDFICIFTKKVVSLQTKWK